MRTTILVRLLVLPLIGWGMLADLPAQAPPAKPAPKKDAPKKPPFDRLPISRIWDLSELFKLGRIVQTRNEAAAKKRIVWVLELKAKLPKDLELDAVLCDDDGGVRYECGKLELKALKKEPGAKVTRLEVIMKMPPKEEHEGVYKVVIRKVG